MTERKKPSGNYEVGFAKPPKHTQFPPGRSGNPSGRPKGRPGLEALIRKRIYQKTKVSIGGEVKSMTVLDAAALRLVQTLLKGRAGEAISAARLLMPMLHGDCEAVAYDLTRLTDEELEILIKLQTKIATNEDTLGPDSQ